MHRGSRQKTNGGKSQKGGAHVSFFISHVEKCEQIIADVEKLPGSKYIIKNEQFEGITDYRIRIPHPLSLETVRNRLRGVNGEKAYLLPNEFALDVRRIFGNFIRFNYYADESKLRAEVCRALFKFEQCWRDLQQELLGKEKPGATQDFEFTQPLPELRRCLSAFDAAVKVKSKGSNQPGTYAVDAFIYPVEQCFQGADLKKYRAVVRRPVSFGEITSRLLEAQYSSMTALETDLQLMASNCERYWMGPGAGGGAGPGANPALGQAFVADAQELVRTFLHTAAASSAPLLLHAGSSYATSSVSSVPVAEGAAAVGAGGSGQAGSASRGKTSASTAPTSFGATTATNITIDGLTPIHPEGVKIHAQELAAVTVPDLFANSATAGGLGLSQQAVVALERKADKLLRGVFKACLEAVKAQFIVIPATSTLPEARVPAAGPFLSAVDPVKFPDYHRIVHEPIDLARIDKKLSSDRYSMLPGTGTCSSSNGSSTIGGSGSAGSGASAAAAVGTILNDMRLLRSNAHQYNTGRLGVDVRVMSACVQRYFQQLLREALLLIKAKGDPQLCAVFFRSLDAEGAGLRPFLYGGTGQSRGQGKGQGRGLGGDSQQIDWGFEDVQQTEEPLLHSGELPEAESALLLSRSHVQRYVQLTGCGAQQVLAQADLLKPLGLPSLSTTSEAGRAAAAAPTVPAVPTAPGASSGEAKVGQKRRASGMGGVGNGGARAAAGLPASKVKGSGGGTGGTSIRSIGNPDGGNVMQPPQLSLPAEKSHDFQQEAGERMAVESVEVKGEGEAWKRGYSLVCRPDKLEWEQACENMWNVLRKHPYVDPDRNSMIADFLQPVVVAYPEVAADYLAVVANPMDLTTLYNLLQLGDQLPVPAEAQQQKAHTGRRVARAAHEPILCPEDFLQAAVRVFQNAVDYNSVAAQKSTMGAMGMESDFTHSLVAKARHLVRYTRWLGLEMLPLEDDTTSGGGRGGQEQAQDAPQQRLLLRSVQQAERRAREELIMGAAIPTAVGNKARGDAECRQLLKDLQKGKNTAERKQVECFMYPVRGVADYAVYVRRRVDLATIRYRLDGELPASASLAKEVQLEAQAQARVGTRGMGDGAGGGGGAGGGLHYQNYGEFLADVQLVFQNALRYTAVHKDRDPGSLFVYEAAQRLQARLEELLPMFTVRLADGAERRRLEDEQQRRRTEQARMRRLRDEQEARIFEKQVIERLKAQDQHFAADLDVQAKQQQTEQQLRALQLERQRQVLRAGRAGLGGADGGACDEDAELLLQELEQQQQQQQQDSGGAGTSTGATLLRLGPGGALLTFQQPLIRSLAGFGVAGHVPERFQHLVEWKLRARERALHRWPVTQQSQQSEMDDPSAGGPGHRGPNPIEPEREGGSQSVLMLTRTASTVFPGAPVSADAASAVGSIGVPVLASPSRSQASHARSAGAAPFVEQLCPGKWVPLVLEERGAAASSASSAPFASSVAATCASNASLSGQPSESQCCVPLQETGRRPLDFKIRRQTALSRRRRQLIAGTAGSS